MNARRRGKSLLQTHLGVAVGSFRNQQPGSEYPPLQIGSRILVSLGGGELTKRSVGDYGGIDVDCSCTDVLHQGHWRNPE